MNDSRLEHIRQQISILIANGRTDRVNEILDKLAIYNDPENYIDELRQFSSTLTNDLTTTAINTPNDSPNGSPERKKGIKAWCAKTLGKLSNNLPSF